MEQGIFQILYTLAIDAIIFTILFILFLATYRHRTRHTQNTVENFKPKNAIFSESEIPKCQLFRDVWNTNLTQVREKCGFFAYVYLSLHRHIIIFLTILSIFITPALVPIYFQGSGISGEDTNAESIGNVLDDENYMIAPIIYFVFYSCIAYWLVYIILKSVTPTETVVFERVIQIGGLNKNKTPKEIEPEVNQAFTSQFQEEIIETCVVPDFTNSYIAYQEINKAKERVEHFKIVESEDKKKGEIRVKCCCGKKVNAVEHYTREIEKFQNEYDEHIEEGNAKNTGFAFVVCKSREAAEKIKEEYKDTNSWSLNPAPAPHEVKWENMNFNQTTIKIRRIVLLAIFIIVFFFFLTPTAFVRYINDAVSNASAGDYVKGIFDTYLPTLLLIIYQSVVVYQAIIFLVKQEKHTDVAAEVVSRMVKYLLFFAFYIFILQAFGMQVVVQVSTDGWDKARTLFPNKIAETGLFFTIFMIHQIGISLGVALWQPGVIIVSKIKQKLAKTPLEKMQALDNPDFDFSYEIAITLNNFLILMCYSCAYPLILVIGLIYYTLRYHIHKYLLLCTFYIDKSSTGAAIPKAYIYSIMSYIFIFQLLTGFIFTINDSVGIQVTGGVLIIVSFIIYLVVMFKLPMVMKFVWKTGKYVGSDNDNENESLKMESGLYVHPIEKAQMTTREPNEAIQDKNTESVHSDENESED